MKVKFKRTMMAEMQVLLAAVENDAGSWLS